MSSARRLLFAACLALLGLIASACSGASPEEQTQAVESAAATLLAAPSSEASLAFVEAVGESGDTRWVPWLLDLLRLDTSLRVGDAAGAALGELTDIASVNRATDLVAYGSWASTQGLDGGDGYREFKIGLHERIDPEFGPLLASVDDPVEFATIQYGGVPVGGIPELNNQERVAAAQADWMIDDQIVMGIVVNDVAVAYPLAILQRHELANDVVGGEPIAVVYCTLCRSGLVFRSTVNDQVLKFQTSGLLLNSNKIMVDRETKTLWHHLRGLGIGGEMLGTELELLSVNHMRWADWVAENPNTEVLTLPDPIFFDDPERPPIAYDYTPGEAYRTYYESSDLLFSVSDTPDTFELKTEVVGIRIGDDAVAFDVDAFNAIGEVAELEVGGENLSIEPTGAGVRVFDENGKQLVTRQSFWFAWFAENPDTRIWESSG